MEAFQQVFIVGAVMATLAGTLWALQRKGLVRFAGNGLKARGDRKLQVLERLQLTPQHALCLVEVEGKKLLIGTAPSSCTVLSEEKP